MSEVRADTAQYSFKVAGQVFQVLGFASHEEVSQLFRYRLTLWSDDPEIDITSLVRQDAEITISWADKQKQCFGIVASFVQTGAGRPGLGGVEQIYGEYEVEVVPTLWLLAHRHSCRIFQNLSSPDIISRVLDGAGMSGKYKLSLSRSFPKREYCVQYRESHLAFISRLMEEEGIFYYFTHDGREQLVLGDSPSAYGRCAPEDTATYKAPSGVLAGSEEVLTELTYQKGASIGKIRYKDFDYRDPRKPLKVESAAEANEDLDAYDFTVERYLDDSRGRSLAKVASEAQAAMITVLSGAGTWRSLRSGCTFTLQQAYRSDLDGDWIVVAAHDEALQEGEAGVQYRSTFTAIPAATAFRPRPLTPWPTLNAQTATVVGPPGEKIYMDDLGRAKVQFHWDLDGHNDEGSSCWVRVAQPYAGIDESSQAKHGFQWHPLIGDEVVVEFLDHNLDRPLIVSSVYNAVNTPPLKPEELIRSVILTPYQHRLLMDDKSSAITFNTGGNETVFMGDGRSSDPLGNNIKISTADAHWIQLADGSDAKGIRAETAKQNLAVLDDKEKNILLQTTAGHKVILDDANETIVVTSKNNHRLEVNDRDQFIEVADSGGSHVIRIDIAGSTVNVTTTGTINVKADANLNVKIGGNMALQVGGNFAVRCAGNHDLAVDGDETVKVSGNQLEKVSGNSSVSVSGNLSQDVSGKGKASFGSELSVSAGTNLKHSAGAKHTISAQVIEESAVAEIKMEAIKITSKASVMNKVQGVIVSSEASGINQLKGTLVKIN